MFEKKPDALARLNELLAQNPTWASFAEKVTAVSRQLVDEPRWKLQRLRHHTPIQRGDIFDTALGTGKVSIIRKHSLGEDGLRLESFTDDVEIDLGDGKATRIPLRSMPEKELMLRNNTLLGFDFFSDKLDDVDMQRIMRYVSSYWPSSGNGNDFIQFLSFVKNLRLDMHQLITPDYGNPDTVPAADPHLYLERFSWLRETKTYDRASFSWDKESPAEGFGGVYPTAHVELELDAVKYYNRVIDYYGITQLFYFLAPIHLVLQRFVSAVYAPQFDTYKKEIGTIDAIQHGIYTWSPDAEIRSKFKYVGNYDGYVSAVLYLEDDGANLFKNSFPAPEGSIP